MNVSILGMQKHNHSQQTLQLVPGARSRDGRGMTVEKEGTVVRVEGDFYGYYIYYSIGNGYAIYWNGPINSYLSKYPAGSWSEIPRSHPWGA